MASVAVEITQISLLLRDLGIHLSSLPKLSCDNIIVLFMSINHVFRIRSKHIKNYQREKVALETLVTLCSFCASIYQSLHEAIVQKCRNFYRKLGIWDVPVSNLRRSKGTNLSFKGEESKDVNRITSRFLDMLKLKVSIIRMDGSHSGTLNRSLRTSFENLESETTR